MAAIVAVGALAAVAALVGLVYVCVGIARRRGFDDHGVRGSAAAVLLAGALVAVGNIAFVVVGTIDGIDDETYTGRQVLYLELSLIGSIALATLLTLAARRLLRRVS